MIDRMLHLYSCYIEYDVNFAFYSWSSTCLVNSIRQSVFHFKSANMLSVALVFGA